MGAARRPVLLITGAARRLGRAVALDLAAQGCDVALHYGHRQQEGEELASEIERLGARVLPMGGDLSDPELPAHLGRIDYVIASGSRFYPTPLETATVEQWSNLFDVNLRAPFLLAQAAAGRMCQAGAMLFFGDIYAAPHHPLSDHIPYRLTKAGIHALVPLLARELGPKGIRVNGIAPGAVLFPDDVDEKVADVLRRRAALGRGGEVQDIVETARFLILGPDFVTGQIIAVDGGR